jgi:endoglucanase
MNELLKTLVELPGACAHEQAVIGWIARFLDGKVDEWHVDGLGNLIVKKAGALPGSTLMVSAHSDEVGFIVKKIEKNGLLRFEKLGGNDDRTLLSELVNVVTDNGLVPGVIGNISAHMRRFDDQSLIRSYLKLYIDIGVHSKEEAEELGVKVGDPICWATKYQEIGKNMALGHAFDDRAGCYCLIRMLTEVDFSKVHGTVYGIFSVQEELGLRGAETAGRQIAADVALAVDTTACSDTFEGMMDDTMALGRGPGVKIMDMSLAASVQVHKKLAKLCDDNNIPWQPEVFTGIGTDAGALHRSNAGVPSSVISLPSRYAHSPCELIDLDDLENCVRLLELFVETMEDPQEFAFLQ